MGRKIYSVEGVPPSEEFLFFVFGSVHIPEPFLESFNFGFFDLLHLALAAFPALRPSFLYFLLGFQFP